MQRPIKFRAWDKTTKSMFEVGEICWFGDGTRIDATLDRVDIQDRESYHQLNTDMELMQYTGLKDKNGKEGYHKDLCQHLSGLYCIEWIATDAKFVLMQTQEGFLKGNAIDIRYLGTMEVIGNIWENKELLDDN